MIVFSSAGVATFRRRLGFPTSDYSGRDGLQVLVSCLQSRAGW